MTSQDNNADTNNIALQLRELIATNREQIAEMKALAAQIQRDNANFQANLIKELANFKENVDAKLTGVHSDIGQINQRIIGIEHDVTGLYHWDYWLLTIIIAIVALPQIISGVKALFAAVAEGIEGIISVLRKKNR